MLGFRRSRTEWLIDISVLFLRHQVVDLDRVHIDRVHLFLVHSLLSMRYAKPSLQPSQPIAPLGLQKLAPLSDSHTRSAAFAMSTPSTPEDVKTRFEILSKGAVLDVLIPKSDAFDAVAVLRGSGSGGDGPSAHKLRDVPLRRHLFFGRLHGLSLPACELMVQYR